MSDTKTNPLLTEIESLPEVREALHTADHVQHGLNRLRALQRWIDLACEGHEDDIECDVVDEIKESIERDTQELATSAEHIRARAIQAVRRQLKTMTSEVWAIDDGPTDRDDA